MSRTNAFTFWVVWLTAMGSAGISATVGSARDPFEPYAMIMYEEPVYPASGVITKFPEGLQALWIKTLQLPDAELKRMVIDSIAIAHRRGMEGWRDARPMLIDILKASIDTSSDANRDLVRAAASTLIALESTDDAPLLADIARRHGGTIAAEIEPALIVWKSSAMVEDWMSRLTSPKTPIESRRLAIHGLAALNVLEATDALHEMTLAPLMPSSLRLSAARALGELHETGQLKLAMQLTDNESDSNPFRVLLALEVLNQHKDSNTREFLTAQLDSDHSAVHSGVLARLFAIDPKLVRPHVAALLESNDSGVRKWLAKAMIKGKDVRDIGSLAILLHDVNPTLRSEVADALVDLADDVSLREEIIQRVTEVLNESEWRGCEQACRVLAKLDHEPAGNRMLDLLLHPRGEVKVASAWGLCELQVDSLLPSVLDHSQMVWEGLESGQLTAQMPGVSRQLAHLLMTIGVARYSAAEPLLVQMIPKKFSVGTYPRPAAIWALGLIHEAKPEEDAREKAAQERFTQAFIDRLQDVRSMMPEEEEVRSMCAISLARMKSISAIPILREFRERSPACAWALEQLTGEPAPQQGDSVQVVRGWILSPLPAK